MKKIYSLRIVALLLIISVLLSGCSGTAADAQTDFEKIMTAFKSADREEIDDAYNFSEVVGFIEGTNGEAFSDAIISTLPNMSYKVNSAERVSGTVVKLNVEITTVDYSEIVKQYIDNVTHLVESSDYKAMVSTITDAEYAKIISEQMAQAIKECSNTSVTKTVDVTMTKSGEKWKISGNSEEFLGALFANLSTAVEALM